MLNVEKHWSADRTGNRAETIDDVKHTQIRIHANRYSRKHRKRERVSQLGKERPRKKERDEYCANGRKRM